MNLWLKTAVIALVGIALSGSYARAQVLPYASYDWYSYPTSPRASEKSVDTQQFPDLRSGVVSAMQYTEEQHTAKLTTAYITLKTTSHSYASLIYYSPAGQAYTTLNALPLPSYHETTVSILLPVNEQGGMTRLLLWSSEPDPGWLPFIARHPDFRDEPVPGVIAEQWFTRKAPSLDMYPWEDQYRPPQYAENNYYMSSAPSVLARVNGNGETVSRDCAVYSSGPVRQGFDDYGLYGQWELDWGSVMKLVFELPQGADLNSASLVVFGHSAQVFGVPASPSFDVTLNGWSIPYPTSNSLFETNVQPIAYELSQYIELGTNELELRLSPMIDSAWLVSRIELWIE